MKLNNISVYLLAVITCTLCVNFAYAQNTDQILHHIETINDTEPSSGMLSVLRRATSVIVNPGNGDISAGFVLDSDQNFGFYTLNRRLYLFGGSGTQDALFDTPSGLDVDENGNLYIADTGNSRIQKFSIDFETGDINHVQTLSSGFSAPFDVVLTNNNTPSNSTDDTFWVLDQGNCQAKQYSLTGTLLYTLGACGSGAGQFDAPTGITARMDGDNISSTEIIVADAGNDRVVFFSKGGSSGEYDDWKSVALPATNLTDVASDAFGNVYATDTQNDVIHIISQANKQKIATYGGPGTAFDQFTNPYSITFAPGTYEVGVTEDWTSTNGIKNYHQGVDIINLSPGASGSVVTVACDLVSNALVSTKVYNSSGQLVRTLVSDQELPAQPNLTFFWSGDDSNGDPVADGTYTIKVTAKSLFPDSLGNPLHQLTATSTINVSSVDDISNPALSFDGSNDEVRIADNELLSGGSGKSITVEAWAKIDNLSNNAPLVMKWLDSQDKDWGLRVKDTGELQVAIESAGDDWEYSVGNVAVGLWNHLAFTFDNSANSVKLYINGHEVGPGATLTGNMPNTSADIFLGKHGYNPEYLDGALAEVRIWNYARTEAEIQSTLTQELLGTESGLLGYWPLNEGTGQVASDIVSGNNGQLGSSSGSDSGDPAWFTSDAPLNANAPNQFTLTTSTVGSGIISLDPAGGIYDLGTVVTVTAVPATGAQFSNWSGDLSGSTNPEQLTMNGNKSVIATFTTASGGTDHSLAFDGTNDEVTISDNDLLSGGPGKSLTVEAWAKINSLSNNAPLVMKFKDSNDKDWGLRVKNTGELQVAIESNGDNWEYLAGSVATGVWTHLAFAFDNSANVARLYVNGNEVGAGATLTSDMANTTADVLFGKHNYSAEYLDGALDEIRVWNIARSEAEIQSTMNQALTGTESGLIGYWPLNEGSGQVASDIVSGNNGQLGTSGSSDSADPTWSTDVPLGQSTTLTFNPTDDAQVKITAPSNNYGDKTSFKADAGNFQSHLKFDVTGISGTVQSAKIRLYVINDSDDGGSVYLTSNDFDGTSSPWTETLLTYDNAPAISGTALSALGTVTLNTWAEFDVSSAVTSDGTYSFGIENNSGNLVEYSSKEDGTNVPELVVETGGGSGNTAPVAQDDSTMTTEDTAVDIDVTANDSDADGSIDVTTVTIVVQPANGGTSVNAITGVVTYTPDAGFSGTDSFSYTVDDNEGATSNIAQVTVTVNASGGGSTLTFNPTDDAQVKITAPTNNYGDKTSFKADAGNFQSHLKFDVTGISGTVQNAKVRLYVINDSDDGGSIYLTSNDFDGTSSPWTEALLTYDNAPAISGTALSNLGTAGLNTWVEFDVTSAITTDGIYSFGIENNSGNLVEYASTEDGNNVPELVVELSPGTPMSSSFNPTDDAQVKITAPGNNYGDKTSFKADDGNFQSHLKFDVTGISGTVQSAKVRLYVINDSDDGGSIYLTSNDHAGTSTPWTEELLNYDNAPALSGAALSTLGTVALNTWVEFDVTSAVTGDGTYSFGIENNSGNLVEYVSKEDGNNAPELVVEYTSSSTPLLTEVENEPVRTSPESVVLLSNYPNPFNPSTTIQYGIPQSAGTRVPVVLQVFNISGQMLRTLVQETKSPGIYTVVWDGRDRFGAQVGSGVHVVRVRAGGMAAARKILLVK